MNKQNIINNANEIIQRAQKFITWAEAHSEQLAQLDAANVKLGTLIGCVDFDYLTHEQALEVFRAFPGGQWEKIYHETRVTYQKVVDELLVRCWQGEPPPLCKIVEVEEVVPEHIVPEAVVKTRKLVCA